MKVIPVQDAVGMVLCHDITADYSRKFQRASLERGMFCGKKMSPSCVVWAKNTSMPGSCRVASCMKMKPRCAWPGQLPEKA